MNAGVEGYDPVFVGKYRIDVELVDLRDVRHQLRDPHQRPVDDVAVGWRTAAVTGEQLGYLGARNQFTSKVQAKAGDQEDSVDEDEPDDEADGEKQRLGMQPGLKNRTSRVSRELSLSMGKGLDNSTVKGRGGPSPQKKSRGTTTMILGVPIPGFVRGRLLPGPTKSTQEEAEPSTRRSPYAADAKVSPATPREERQERYRPSLADGALASRYLIDLHKNVENKKKTEKGSTTDE